MWKPYFLKGAGEVAKRENDYELTSVTAFNEAVFLVHDKDGQSVNIATLALKVGDRLSCISKGGGGHPQFKFGDYIISTSFKADGKPESYGLKLVS